MSSRKKQSFLEKCNEVFLKMDLFSNGEFLKYRGEGAYQTYTGSILSILIVIICVAVSFNFCKQTFNREKIINTSKLRPSLGTSFNTNESNSAFMFAVGLEGFDLTSEEHLFDIYMTSKVYKNGKPFSSVDVALQPCQLEQWQSINDQFKNLFARLNLQQWLCPPKNYNFTFKGKFTSEEFQYTQLVVRRCNPALGKCASSDQFTTALMDHSTFKLSVYFANPVIDASEKQYLDYVLEDTNYFEFTDILGVSAHIFFSEYEVNTDNSVYPEPFSDVVTERGLTLNERPVVSNFGIINTDEFVRINLKKADLIQQFDRSYTRFDVTFAYIGGLFGMVLMLFYGMMAFSEYAYEFEIERELLVYNDKEKFDNGKFHIFRFPLYLLYCIFTFFYSGAEEWSCFRFYRNSDEYRNEFKEKTDVCFLIKRVIYIGKAIWLFFSSKLSQIHERIKNMILTSEKKEKKYAPIQEVNVVVAEAPPDIMQNNNELGEHYFGREEIRFSPKLKEEEDVIIIEDDIEVEVEMTEEIGSRYEQISSRNELHTDRTLDRGGRRRAEIRNLAQYSKEKEKPQSQSESSSSEELKELLENKEITQISNFNAASNHQKGKQGSNEKKEQW